MSRNGISFDAKQLKDLEKELEKLFLTDNDKYEITSKVAKEAVPILQDETPEKHGVLKDSYTVKRGTKNKGMSVISNEATNPADGERYGWILNYREDTKYQGWFDRLIDEKQDEIEDMLLKELEKKIRIIEE